ncbi:conjugal transfer mating pair stabilization protein TraG (plasmid) [Klebsiella quasipneumoniae]|uniref:conjugal transfer protein TraG N-terminal domain-containing protein n=2 Tax=Gammaproteobacteria TaxID=1236 RepID=UPI002270DF0F|nr:conjugal transfer protein TraG N-terminal domain-containing protein [Klebsiella quasipneumoniae]CAH1460227.1 conjugal transfer mating pair stabilization protein TraG [Klebsiella quasipneumoniae]
MVVKTDIGIITVSMLVVIRTPVQIIDYSNVAQVYEVDNVPIGLAIPASLTTRVGNALIQSYEMVFALPDSVTYSKTGMLFGSNLVAKKVRIFYHKILRLRRCSPITYKTV